MSQGQSGCVLGVVAEVNGLDLRCMECPYRRLVESGECLVYFLSPVSSTLPSPQSSYRVTSIAASIPASRGSAWPRDATALRGEEEGQSCQGAWRSGPRRGVQRE